MTKTEIIKAIADQAGITQTQAKAALSVLADLITSQLACGGDITLPEIGAFSVHDLPERQGRNPQTGAEITIAAQRKVKFRTAAGLRRAVNGDLARDAAE